MRGPSVWFHTGMGSTSGKGPDNKQAGTGNRITSSPLQTIQEGITMATQTPKKQSEDKPVDIIQAITDHLERYFYFPDPGHAPVLALWILHTWEFHESFPMAPWVTPYIYINSSGPACGKTLLLDLMEPLVRRCKKSGDMSSAAMFRIVEETRPTIMIDEVDTIWNGAKNDDLRRTLNTGYKHGGCTDRVSGNTVETFSTFCPKVLAGIRDNISEIPGTVLTRSIPINLIRRPDGVKLEKYYAFRAGPVAEELAEIISAWMRVNADKILEYEPNDGNGLEDRAFEISFPLLQIAHAAGIERQAREALARLLAPEPEKEAPEIMMLRTIKALFDDRNADKLYTRDIMALFGWNGKKLGAELNKFGITGGNTIQINGDKPSKGYWRNQFTETWERFGI